MGVSERMTTHMRNTLIAACIATTAAMIVPSTLPQMVMPMQQTLHADPNEMAVLRRMPDVISMLVVFPIAAIGVRFGPTLVFQACGTLMIVGSFLVMFAPIIESAIIGLAFVALARVAVTISALAAIAMVFAESPLRARAFARYGMMSPIVYLVVPLLAGFVLSKQDWRVLVGFWLSAGIATLLSGALLRDRAKVAEPQGTADRGGSLTQPPQDSRKRVELWTPFAAGFVLLSAVQALAEGVDFNFNPEFYAWCAATAVFASLFALARRRVARPAFRWDAFRVRGFSRVLIALAVFSGVNLHFYVMLVLQYGYAQSPLATASLMLPAQCTGVVGAIAAGRWMMRKGAMTIAHWSLWATAGVLVASAWPMLARSPFTIAAILCVYGFVSTIASIALTTTLMQLGDAKVARMVAALRSSMSGAGSAIGIIVLSFIVSEVMVSSMSTRVRSEGGSDEIAAKISAAIRHDEATSSIAETLDLNEVHAQLLSSLRHEVILDGFAAHGIAGGIGVGVAAILLATTMRRRM